MNLTKVSVTPENEQGRFILTFQLSPSNNSHKTAVTWLSDTLGSRVQSCVLPGHQMSSCITHQDQTATVEIEIENYQHPALKTANAGTPAAVHQKQLLDALAPASAPAAFMAYLLQRAVNKKTLGSSEEAATLLETCSGIGPSACNVLMQKAQQYCQKEAGRTL